MIISIDFHKVDKKLARYLRERIQKRSLKAKNITALLIAFEGVVLPDVPCIILEPTIDVNFEEVRRIIMSQDNMLWRSFLRLEFWIKINRVIGSEIDDEEKIKNELAKIISNFI